MGSERRQEPRRSRRVHVRFARSGTDQRFHGFTTNVSNTGMFVASSTVFPIGQRLRLEIASGERSFVAEGVVARAIRSSQVLQRLVASGMGIRFLGVRELLEELLPQIATQEAAAPAGPVAPAAAGAFEVRFTTAAQFLEAFRRDIATGGLFVPTFRPAPLDTLVTIRLVVIEGGQPPVEVRARVVQSFEPRGDGDATANLLAGMGVELSEPAAALPHLEALAARLSGGGRAG